jgi:hypothetical protein
MAKYTVRITNDDNGINAWIDMDGQKCIMQPHHPNQDTNWKTEAEAKAWADQHALDLETAYKNSIAEAALKKEREDAQHAANLATVETSKALAAILEKLANPSA